MNKHLGFSSKECILNGIIANCEEALLYPKYDIKLFNIQVLLNELKRREFDENWNKLMEVNNGTRSQRDQGENNQERQRIQYPRRNW